MTYRLTFLGTGSSGGVPRIGNVWGACDPQNPKNRRRRCAVMIERQSQRGSTAVLIDTPPDLRDGLLACDKGHADAVFFTHDHADHTHGIDDLRVFALMRGARLPVHMDDRTYDSLLMRFRYCFEQNPGSSYPVILQRKALVPGTPQTITGAGGPITLTPILQEHGDLPSLGFRVGNVCYSSDIVGVPPESEPLLQGLDLWIVDALRPTPHPAHWNVRQALDALAKYGAKRGVLTHMTQDLDYETLRAKLPPHIEPAYDGMTVTWE